ncbi:hypothetical protein INT43_007439 [Umbelopsis isabellina]|uniref:Importin N-terminal domain-containing protein n=1 Tax=Mortierella isabellina TaxID=91625 RepID=A0A8H7PYD4_MORIS|nr:hypothetical protein INT43_007439 [Umbelopsis isabellina]
MEQNLIPSEALAQLSTLLVSLPSADNDVRTQAEAQLNDQWIAQQPDVLLLGLAQLASASGEDHVRAFSSVLLRRIAFKSIATAEDPDAQLWSLVQENTRQAVKSALLVSLSKETNESTRHKLCDTISEIAKTDLLKGEKWSQLMAALFECSRSPSAELREASLRIFTAVPDLISDQHNDALKGVFSASLADPESQNVRIAALKAAVSYILQADPPSQKALGSLMPHMLEVLTPLAATPDEDALTDSIMTLIDLAENCPRLFRSSLPNVVTFMINIAKEKKFEDALRQTALELLMTLTEAAPGMVRKLNDFTTQVIPVALEMMTDMEDDEKWYTTDDLDDDDSEENYVVGEHAMDRLARYLGGKSVLPVSFQFIPQMLQSEQWQQRHAALMAISAIGEGCVKIMEPELGSIIQLIVPYFKDPSARVRYATCNAVGQMSTDFAPVLQKKFYEMVLSSLIPVMEDSEPRVQAHAAAALVNFCEEVDKAVLDPYLDPLFERLLVLLNTSKTYVQEQAITTIATVADSAEDKFIKYHGAIMPLLLNILRQATAKQYRLLRGKAMECASLIALAVGKEVFAPFVQEFINLLIESQQSVTESDDPQTSYLLASWARMCKVLGPDFLPYLPVIMPPLLQSAQLKPDFAVLDPDEDAEANYSAEDGWEFVGVEGQQVGIKTTVLEEKCTAVEMLICYARELGAGFLPYIPQVLDIVLPLLKFYFHDGVRQAAACVVPLLLQDAKKANVNAADISSMWHTIYAKLVDVIMNEMDPSFLLAVYMAFYESLEIVGENAMTAEELEKFILATESQLKEFYERLQTRQNNRAAADFDAEEEEAMLEEEEAEESVMSELARAIHTVFMTHRLTFLPYFDKILPSVVHFLQHENPSARQWALCVFDDLIEFTGPQSFAYSNHFLERMVAALSDQNNDVRQAAAYGVGACGQFGGPQYADACSAALNPLFAIINAPNSREVDNVYVTENAISAVSKICRFNSGKFEVEPVLSAWVAALPITNDEEEAPTTYQYLMDLVDAGHPSIVGGNNLPQIVKIYVEVLSADVLKGELADRMANGLKSIVGGLDDATRNQLWSSIEPEKASKLQQRLA